MTGTRADDVSRSVQFRDESTQRHLSLMMGSVPKLLTLINAHIPVPGQEGGHRAEDTFGVVDKLAGDANDSEMD